MKHFGLQETGSALKKRALDRIKCRNCRRDKQKCTPQERQWPGNKCDRCKEKGFSCSANERASKRKRASSIDPISSETISSEEQKDILTERYLQIIIARILADLRLNTTKWKSIFPEDCLQASSKSIRIFRDHLHATETVLRERQEDRWGKDRDHEIGKTSLLSSLLGDAPQFGIREKLIMAFGYDWDRVTAYANRVWSEGDLVAGDLILENVISGVSHYEGEFGHGIYRRAFVQLIEHRLKTASETDKCFTENILMMDVEPAITRHVVPSRLEDADFEYLPNALLEGGKDFAGRTYLHHAAESAEPSCFARLLAIDGLRAEINVKDLYGRTPLHIACERKDVGRFSVVNQLCKAGADQDTRAFGGLTPLHFAAASGQWERWENGLERTELPLHFLHDEFQRTPVFYAAMNGHEKVVKFMCKGRTPLGLYHFDIHHRTALSWAAERGHEQVVRTIMDLAPAPYDTRWIQDDKGIDPIRYARNNGHASIVDFLLEPF